MNQFPPLQALWNRESGWNAYAVNPSSGAYGIPQSLGHGHPFNLGDYVAQIWWGLRYIAGRYGSPAAAWGHELSAGWYDNGGWLPTGVSLAINKTGRPERILGPGEGSRVVVEFHAGPSDFDQFMLTWLRKAARIRGGGNVQLAFGH
jgi:SLT domain-containing protein